jgi:hypothetical protein
MNVHWVIKLLLSTNQPYNFNPNDNILRPKLIQIFPFRLIKLTTLALAEGILESKYLDERSLSDQTLLSTKQAYNYNPNDNYKPNDNILRPKLIQISHHDWSNSQLLH